MVAERVEAFVRLRLGAQTLPLDLCAVLSSISSNPDFELSDSNPLTKIGAEFLWVDNTYPLLDHDYLNDQDLADLDIMANVQAMQDTDKKLKFVIQCEDTSLLGYWQPDASVPLEACALFWLDTEGQYYLTEGKTLSETLAYRALVDGDEDTYRSLSDAFERLGINVPDATEDGIFAEMDARTVTMSEVVAGFRPSR